jgi:hypothetical protein
MVSDTRKAASQLKRVAMAIADPRSAVTGQVSGVAS